MAETGAAVVDEAAAVTDPGDRGSLRVRDRAIEHLVEAAVLTTPGVRRHGKALSNLVGHDLPRVDAVVAGDHVRTAVEVAAEWGRPLAALSADARGRITTALRDHAGLTVDGVTVHVATIVPQYREESVATTADMAEKAEVTAKSQAPQQTTVRAAPVPLAAAGASKVAVLVAVLLAALGVVAVRDAVVGLGWASGSTWLPAVAGAVDGFEPAAWVTVAGAAMILLGLVVVAVALAPRRRTAVAVTAQTPMYLTVDGIAALAGAAARDVAGVIDARATSSRRRVVVRCRVTRDDSGAMRGTITDAVTRSLGALQSPPRVVVRTRTEEIS